MTRNTDSAGLGGLNSFRRDVLKAAGAGGALAMLSTTASADQSGAGDDDQDTEADETADDADTHETGTVHVVRTLITQSTSPDRPADFFYQPTGLHVDPGDVVKFVFETPDHNVVSYHPAYAMQRRVPVGVDPFSSPILGWKPRSIPGDMVDPPAEPHGGNGENGNGTNGNGGDPDENGEAMDLEPSTWLHAFEEPGVYDMECAPHEVFGMAMRVVVGNETETAFETSDPANLPEPRAGPVGFARLVLTDPALEPEAIVEAGRVEWQELDVNQMNGEPTEDDDSTDENDVGEPDAENGDADPEDE